MGSTATQIAAVNSSLTDLIAHAQRLGLATDTLTDAQTKQVATINQAQWAAVAASGATITAESQKQNGDSLGSQLTTFDADTKPQLAGLVTEFPRTQNTCSPTFGWLLWAKV